MFRKWLSVVSVLLSRKSKNIKSLRKQGKTNAIRLFLSPESSKSSSFNQKEGPLSLQFSLKSAKLGPMEIQEGLLSSFILDENTLNAEIIWCLNVVKSHIFKPGDSLKTPVQNYVSRQGYSWQILSWKR